MAVLWELQVGDTRRFAIRLAFGPDPHDGRGADRDLSLSWGSFQLWADGRNLCAHMEEGDRLDSVHWYLLPLIEWFAHNWNPLFHEERLPARSAGASAWESLRKTRFPPPAVEADEALADKWYSDWQSWWHRHALRSASEGGLLPDVVFRRFGDSVEISWGNARSAGMPADFDFLEHAGAVHLSPQEVTVPLHQVLTEAVGHLISVNGESERLDALNDTLDLRSLTVQRQEWLAGQGTDLETLTDYDSITSSPDREGWIQFLRDRVFFSFKTIGRPDAETFSLSEPTLDVNFDDPIPFCESFNLWLRGLSFYAAGKIVDANEIGGLLDRSLVAGTIGLTLGPMDAWNSIQAKRMFQLLNTNKLDAERAMTTLLLQALEFIIKAVLIHCNYYSTKKFCFQAGHKLHVLYDALPDSCRREIEREVGVFFDDFYADRERAQDVVRRIFGSSGGVGIGSIMKNIDKFKDYMEGRQYFDMWQEDEPHGTDMRDYVRESLRICGDLVKHRYGPTPPYHGEETAIDPYSTHAVASAQIMTRFFFEHLFGWETIVERSKKDLAKFKE